MHLVADLAPTFPQRVWFVELAALADPTLLPLAVAAVLGVRETAGNAIRDAISGALGAQPALLVLDNCEHLIDESAALADYLLASCPMLRILATSREPLQIAGERQYRVAPLALPASDASPGVDTLASSPAVQLFIARAQAVAPAFTSPARMPHSLPTSA
ncbi:MAG TPA: hypothetical protein VGW38_03560 [Chloroflexota bacterium]|nr:hypothetical protein [Chloroflexota bacterium]